jgi:O-acetylhomoserine (thiol)-lyase
MHSENRRADGCDTDKTFRFLDALRLILPATILGEIRSGIVKPARRTHQWLSEGELAATGISPGTLSMSVGIENTKISEEDLGQQLEACH